MTVHKTPYTAEIRRLSRIPVMTDSNAARDFKQLEHLRTLAEGYRQCQADYAPLLEAAKTAVTRLRLAYGPILEGDDDDSSAERIEPQHSIQVLLAAAIAAVEGRNA